MPPNGTTTTSAEPTAAGPLTRTFIKMTLDGRKVEVIGTAICLDGKPEADRLLPVIDHPNWRAILDVAPDATHMAGRIALTVDEAEKAHYALLAAREAYESSPLGIAERTRQAINEMLKKRSEE
jgi:hypothetical protein